MKRHKNGLHFEIAKLFSTILQFEIVQHQLPLIFGIKRGKFSEGIPDFKHQCFQFFKTLNYTGEIKDTDDSTSTEVINRAKLKLKELKNI